MLKKIVPSRCFLLEWGLLCNKKTRDELKVNVHKNQSMAANITSWTSNVGR